jgi:ABC-type antimicrobial peptide transport system permease subunit
MLRRKLALIGIYGFMSYTVSQRTREIGIRMALGAKAADVLRLMRMRSLLVAGCGVAVGLLGASGSTPKSMPRMYSVRRLAPNRPTA